MKEELNKQFEAKGDFSVLGWGDAGAAKMMTVGFEVHKPTDLQGKGVFFFAGMTQFSRRSTRRSAASRRSSSPSPRSLPNLTNGSINVIVVAPPLAAEQLQWASRITHISTQTLAFAIGAFVLSCRRR